MAEIRPLRAWRYHHKFSDDIEELTSPLFDVITAKQRDELYDNPINSIHLSVPLGSEPVENSKRTLLDWKLNEIIKKDELPGVYVYYQYFSIPGHTEELIRKGFICNIRIYDWEEDVILRHEDTMPGSVNDRTEVLHQTQLNVSPTHGLYTDESQEIEKFLDDAIKYPIYEVEDYQGVRDVFSVIHDQKIIMKIIRKLKDKKVILADGHHRYQGSLQYQKQRAEQNPQHTGQEPYNYHLMYLTNTENDNLRILPTHRIFRGFDEIEENKLLERTSAYFEIKPVANPPELNDIIRGKKWSFGLLFGNNAYRIHLKEEKINVIKAELPEFVKEIDLTVLHHLFIDKVLNIPWEKQSSSSKLKYERNFTECLREVVTGEANFALITNEISIEQIKNVCYSGYTLPQKSTYIYPKVICGFLFSSIDENETKTRLDSCFGIA